jgi:transcriptional regulator with XRE-family HTH domain
VNQDFPRIITLLRKERGLSQKSAAESLGVSQALLSHYEKGIRECGLDFVVRTADFYSVSTDYLLGRSPSRSGATITVDELPEGDTISTDPKGQGSMLPILQKKLLSNTLNILFLLLQECGSRQLTTEISTYLSASVYKAFRIVYSANEKNPQGMFAVPPELYSGYTDALQHIAETRAGAVIAGDGTGRTKGLSPEKVPALSPEVLATRYPLFATSLVNLVHQCEERMQFSTPAPPAK